MAVRSPVGRLANSGLLVSVLLLVLCILAGCGGGGEYGGSVEEPEQASEDTLIKCQDALNAALEQSFSESGAPEVVAAV